LLKTLSSFNLNACRPKWGETILLLSRLLSETKQKNAFICVPVLIGSHDYTGNVNDTNAAYITDTALKYFTVVADFILLGDYSKL